MTTSEPHPPNLLVTKLTAPLYPRRIVHRARLTDLLDEGTESKLTLVVAPAGFGKTTVLREWTAVAEQRDWPTAWVLLDRDDDGPRIWAYLLEALRTIDSSIAFDWREMAKSPDQTIAHAQLGPLVNQIAAVDGSFSIILEDYHEVRDNSFHLSLAHLIDHLPQNIHLVIASRTTPPIPLARLRTQGQLTEVGATDLSFTKEETEEFLTEVMGLCLFDEDVVTLLDKTEGWIAALQMAVLSLKGGRTARSIVKEFSGDHRQVFAYLTEEVIDQQPSEIRDFLLKTSLLSAMSAGLCDRVLDATDSRELLARLERANLFITPLDERHEWYRYHQLFAEYLRSRLALEQPEQIRHIHEAAAAWLLANGHFDQAIPHAFACEDYEQAATAIEAYVERSVLSSDLPVVLKWIERLPKDVIRGRIQLALHVIMARLAFAERNAFAQAIAELLDVDGTEPSDGPGAPDTGDDRDVNILRITEACIQGEYDRAIALYEDLMPLTEDRHYLVLGMLFYHMHLAFLAHGRFDEAVEVASKARDVAREHALDDEYLSTTCAVARLERLRGRLRVSAALYQDAVQYAHRHAIGPAVIGLVEAGLSDVFREWGRLDRADELIETAKERANEPARYLEWNIAPDHLTVLVRNCLAHDDFEGARRFLDEVELALPKYYKIPFLATQTRSLEVRYWLGTGDFERAAEWLDEMRTRLANPRAHISTIEKLAAARAAFVLGRTQEALEYVPPVETGARGFPLFESRIEHAVLRALALSRNGDRAAARASLLSALRLAAPERYMQVFVDEGSALRPLLASVLSDLRQGAMREVPASMIDFAQSLWTYCCGSWTEDPAAHKDLPAAGSSDYEPLSARELEVLKLLSAGASAQEISGTLFISVHTTRTHIKNVYQKLGVHSRDEAIERAIMASLL